MSSLRRLSQIFESSERIPIDDSSKIILMSDCHRGDGSQADDYFNNENLFISAMNHYYNEGYTYIEIGDGDELWENKKLSAIVNAHPESFKIMQKFHADKRLYFIYGNHDMVKRRARYVKANMYEYYDRWERQTVPLFRNVRVCEGLVLEYTEDCKCEADRKILLVHGHQVDLLNSDLWRLARFLVRYVWKPLTLFGITNPFSPAENPDQKEKIGSRLTEWVVKENKMLVGGHNHRPMFPEIGEPLYFNDGSLVHPHFITAIEIEKGKIALVKWSVKVKGEGVLFIGKDDIAGPTKLKEFFEAKRIYETCSLRDISV